MKNRVILLLPLVLVNRIKSFKSLLVEKLLFITFISVSSEQLFARFVTSASYRF